MGQIVYCAASKDAICADVTRIACGEREFECRSVRYKVKIDPAKISDRDGVTRDYYPSKREELVEDALRKFACEGQGLFLDDQAGVTFTLY